MPLFNDLLSTYEKEKDNNTFPEKIAPIGHEYGQVGIQITITEDGGFINASEINKDQKTTLLAVTALSQTRTGGAAERDPHALNDKLMYLTKDMAAHCPSIAGKSGENVSYTEYKKQLESWCKSKYSHPGARAVLKYVEERDVVGDLIGAGILSADRNGILGGTGSADKDEKYQEVSMALPVRFCVLFKDGKGRGMCRTWEDAALIDSWTAYYTDYIGGLNEKDLDGLTGENQDVPPHDPERSVSYPKKILAGAEQAKLISIANDESGKKNGVMNFKGERFTEESQRLRIGYITSQKIHNTLRWLVETQSIRISAGGKDRGNRCIICWAPSFENTDVYDAAEELFRGNFSSGDYVSGGEDLKKAVQYGEELSLMKTGLTVAAFDAATSGRFTMVFYQKMLAREFFDRLDDWYEQCSWYFGSRQDCAISSPSIFLIAKCAFGTERVKNKQSYLDVDGKLFKETVQDITAHILNGQPLPDYIVRAIVTQASEPMEFAACREPILRTACAVVRQRLLTNKQEGEAGMELNRESTDRSYLFGRILAVEDEIEQSVLNKRKNESDNGRETNARRLWSAYVNHPMTTWQELRNLILPYEAQLSAGSRVFYQKTLEEIVSKFKDADMSSIAKSNRALEPQYLLGFYLQRRELRMGGKTEQDRESEQQ